MTDYSLTDRSLTVLSSPALALPKPKSRRSFDRLLELTFDTHRACLAETDGELAALLVARRDDIDTLTSSLVASWSAAAAGRADEALDLFNVGLAAIETWLASMSRRLSKVLDGQSWYRLSAWEGVTSREHMFHVPFGNDTTEYRFSVPGAPSLYLANSVYLCWLECGRPRFDRCNVSRFELDASGYELLNIPANSESHVRPLNMSIPGVMDVDPRQVMNSPYHHDIIDEVAEYLTVWPLLAAATFEKRGGHAGCQPGYLLPQLFARWVERSDTYLGIRYFTSKFDPSTNSQDWSIDVALPCRERKSSGYSDFLSARARWTKPQLLAHMRRFDARDLASPDAVEVRESRGGRVMLQRGSTMQHYFETSWGKMEYWLDRPELELSTI
ncbi:MAG: hypothetical protein QNM02_04245 [Acidimicrobiia bacterium]|nr:hypothetical protein [Acidimicrobiia bacterium]